MAAGAAMAANAAIDVHKVHMQENTKRMKAANDYANDLRTKQRAVDRTFGMTEEQFANLTKYDRADRAMDTTDRGLSLVERNWKAVIIIFIIVLILYFIFRNRIKSMVGSLVGRVKQANKKSEIESKTGQQCTLSDEEMSQIADTISSTLGGFADSEYAVAAQICLCQNQADWDTLKFIYGTRKLRKDALGLVYTEPLSLSGAICRYFDESAACTKIYSHFLSHRIKDDAVLNYLYGER
ncbi:MAG: hypothetical protein IKQ94_05680 [Bacteroidales bacterium]|nr:hypothetical protein [Bacteroidales bacterium]